MSRRSIVKRAKVLRAKTLQSRYYMYTGKKKYSTVLAGTEGSQSLVVKAS